ncbi:MAG: hypothetical protein M3Z36_14235 [Acidobacteriota bacterium]|nr:hypothetical protein [Acidobacteriota bacterium]
MRVFIVLQLLLIGWPMASMAQRPVPPEPVPGQAAPKPGDPNRVPSIEEPTAAAEDIAAQDTATEYTGPGILSRGFSANRPTLLQPILFQPFAGISAIYNTGLTGLTLNPNGQISSVDSLGTELSFGITGRRVYKNDVIGLNYRGTLNHYNHASYYDGTNHLLDLDFKHRATKHVSINLKESAGMYSNNTTLLNSIGLSDPSIAGTDYVVTPNTQAFDNRVIFLSSQADLVVQKSARLSFNLGGGGFLVRRRSSSLYGVSGYQARADSSYRITKKTTLGIYYAFSHYTFTKAFGGSDVNTIGVNYSLAINRRMEFRLRAGASRAETLGLITVQVDPVIAAILGQAYGVQTIYRVNYAPDVSAQITREFKDGKTSIEYTRGVTPGNGVFLTSTRESASIRADYSGIHRYALSFGGGRDTMSSLGVALGRYSSYYGRGGVVRNLAKSVQGDAHLEYRTYKIESSKFNRNQLRVSIGLTFSPSERPLSIW